MIRVQGIKKGALPRDGVLIFVQALQVGDLTRGQRISTIAILINTKRGLNNLTDHARLHFLAIKVALNEWQKRAGFLEVLPSSSFEKREFAEKTR